MKRKRIISGYIETVSTQFSPNDGKKYKINSTKNFDSSTKNTFFEKNVVNDYEIDKKTKKQKNSSYNAIYVKKKSESKSFKSNTSISEAIILNNNKSSKITEKLKFPIKKSTNIPKNHNFLEKKSKLTTVQEVFINKNLFLYFIKF